MQDKTSNLPAVICISQQQSKLLFCCPCRWCQPCKSLSRKVPQSGFEPETYIETTVFYTAAPAGGASPAGAGGHLACYAASGCCPAQPPAAGTALAEGDSGAGRGAPAHRACLQSPDAVRPSGVSSGVAKADAGPQCLPQHWGGEVFTMLAAAQLPHLSDCTPHGTADAAHALLAWTAAGHSQGGAGGCEHRS